MKKREFEHLKNPPAVEAVLDITTNELDEADLRLLDVETVALKNGFPKKDQIHLFEGCFSEKGKEHQVSYKNKPLGYSYKSDDQKEIAQFRVNGFSYNRLQPYPGWNDFIKSGLEAWSIYKDIRKRVEIKRLGLRFINVIEVPGETVTPSKYFKVAIESQLKAGLGRIRQFQYKYVREFEENDCFAIVNFAQLAQRDAGPARFVLDIDVIKEAPAKGLEELEVSKYLEHMRQAKNTVFFDTLKSGTLERYRK